ncbi:TPR repeat [Carpediemonas membranifera]|uniref:Outer dynein arm-docking complex subunit 4 n=1 Tax=Carpediemonas membranifera TaxID=201153 RepID=A0A8J6E986_9EUKA|nr:TPR repeat [Carpediemonas membranifera]|eukprot:KAG9392965.1 TPR repeat [Carpediemonas membranifera]
MDKSGKQGQADLFHIYTVEGDTFIRQESFERAVAAYSKALELKEEDRHCLLNRSRCYVRLGQYDLALTDAKKCAGAEDHQATFQQAEVLYASGDFEYALVHYHRAHRIRPDILEYQLGIRKAESAIARAISLGDDTGRPGTSVQSPMFIRSPMGIPVASNPATPMPTTPKAGADGRPKPSRKLLGDLYDDQEFLKKLQGEPAFRNNATIAKVISTGLEFIDSRTEFWRQQQSPTAHRRSKSALRFSRPGTAGRPSTAGGRLGSTGRATIGGRGNKLTVRTGQFRPQTSMPGSRPAAPKTRPGTSGSRPNARSRRYKQTGPRHVSMGTTLGGTLGSSMRPPTAPATTESRRVGTPRRTRQDPQTEVEEKRKYMRATHYVSKVMTNIEEALKTGAPDLALQFGKSLLSRLSTLEVPDHGMVTADAHSVMGTIYMALDRPTPAVIHHKKDLDISLEHGDLAGHVRALRQLANAYIRLDDGDMAIAVATKLIDGDQLSPPSYVLGEALLQRGRARYEQKHYEQAAEDAEHAWAVLNEPSLSREPGTDAVDTAIFGYDGDLASSRAELQLDGLCLHGRCLMAVGKDDEAAQRLQLCLELARGNRDRTAEAAALTNLSVIALSQGDVQEGKRLQREAVSVSKTR